MGKSTNTDITEFLKNVYGSVGRKETTIGLYSDLSKLLNFIS